MPMCNHCGKKYWEGEDQVAEHADPNSATHLFLSLDESTRMDLLKYGFNSGIHSYQFLGTAAEVHHSSTTCESCDGNITKNEEVWGHMWGEDDRDYAQICKACLLQEVDTVESLPFRAITELLSQHGQNRP